MKIENTITLLRHLGKDQTSENHSAAMHSFNRLTGGRDMTCDQKYSLISLLLFN